MLGRKNTLKSIFLENNMSKNPLVTETNPANTPGSFEVPKDFIPMSAATLRLDTPVIPGYHLHWFRGDAGRINRAQRAGYQFVDQDEVDINNFDLGGDAKTSGNTDLGSRISITSGDEVDRAGQPTRMYLMKCSNHLYELGQKDLIGQNESLADVLRSGRVGLNANGEAIQDVNARYTKGKPSDLFTRKSWRA